jgi:hypothetical protein
VLNKLDPAARALAEYMSDLSEEAYYAAWMQDLEFDLWSAVIGGPRTYGRLEITGAHLARLTELSAAANGWIVFDDAQEETLVPLADWKRRFESWSQQ